MTTTKRTIEFSLEAKDLLQKEALDSDRSLQKHLKFIIEQHAAKLRKRYGNQDN